ncbi:MAG: hypothetical protein IJW24_01455, partial [Clostridia bacterium]|nr:hypothetical protein [Clostridia bacterium]
STIVSKLTPKSNLENMSGFLSSTFKWILGGTCTVFMTMLSLQGVVAATKDGLSIKAAKYAIKNYIPFLGGYISEGFEIVKAGSLLVKNAVGIVSVVLIFFTIIKPILYLAILSLGLKLVCGISGVVDNLKISGILMSIANCLKFLVAIVIGVACMYFFLLMILIGTGNNII